MRFRLLAQHYLHDRLLEAGTEIGDGTPYPFLDQQGNFAVAPSAQMQPLDDEASHLFKETADRKQNWGRPVDSLPVAPGSPALEGRVLNTVNNAPIFGPTTTVAPQPPIPAPIEHILRPSDLKPGETAPTSIIPQRLADELADERAAEADRRNAEIANRRDEEKAAATKAAAGNKGIAPKTAPSVMGGTKADDLRDKPQPADRPQPPPNPQQSKPGVVPPDSDKTTPTREP